MKHHQKWIYVGNVIFIINAIAFYM